MPLLESSHSHGDVADMRRIRDTILYGEILSESTRGERDRLLTVSLFAMAASVLEFTPGVVKLAEGLSFQPPARWLFDIIVAAVLGYYTLIFGISANRDRRHWETKIDEGLSSVQDALSAEGGRLLAEEIALEREQKSCDELKSVCKDLEDEIPKPMQIYRCLTFPVTIRIICCDGNLPKAILLLSRNCTTRFCLKADYKRIRLTHKST